MERLLLFLNMRGKSAGTECVSRNADEETEGQESNPGDHRFHGVSARFFSPVNRCDRTAVLRRLP